MLETLGVQDISYSQPSVEGNKIYWTEEKGLGWIQRAKLDGAYEERVVTTLPTRGIERSHSL